MSETLAEMIEDMSINWAIDHEVRLSPTQWREMSEYVAVRLISEGVQWDAGDDA